MTVAELIALLSSFPGDMPVLIGRDEDAIDVTSVLALPVLLNEAVPHDRMDYPGADLTGTVTAVEIR